MFCKHCGDKIEDDSIFCSSCGKEVSQEVSHNAESNGNEGLLRKVHKYAAPLLNNTQFGSILNGIDQEQLDAFENKIKECLNKIRESISSKQEFTYEEAMRYFIAHKNDSPKIAKGVILKMHSNNGILVTLAFLDKNNGIVCDNKGAPFGFKQQVGSLDTELLKLFKNTDMVIVG